jgi:hypothetical protein
MEMAEEVATEEEEMAVVVTEAEEMEVVEAGGLAEARGGAAGSAEVGLVALEMEVAAGSAAARAAAAVAAGSAAVRVAVAVQAATEAWGSDMKSTRSTHSCFQRNCTFEAMRKRSCKSLSILGCSSRIPDQQRKTTTLYSAGSAGSAAGVAGSADSAAGSVGSVGSAADWATAEAGEGLAAAVAQGTEAKSSP